MALLEPRSARPLAVPDAYVRATLQQINGTDPGAGVEVTQTVPAGKAWGLLSVSVALVQGITNTPQPILVLDDGVDVVYESFGSSAAQAVSTTCRYTWAVDNELTAVVGATTNCHANAPLADGLLLPEGYRVRTTTIGIAATADYGVPSLLVVEYSA